MHCKERNQRDNLNGNEILNNENTILRKQLNKYSKRKENIRTTT